MHIAPYKQGNLFNAEPRRKRKLLLHREQINKLIGRVQQKGYTLVPLKFYFTRGKAKLELGVGKGRQRHDKRHAIEEREIRREINTES
jgi:SsrA-binding protein